MKKIIFCLSLLCLLSAGCNNAGKHQQIKSLQDLKDKKVIVTSGSSQESFMMQNLPEAELCRVQNLSDMYIALKSGKGDVIVDEYEGLATYKETNGGIDIVVDSLFGTPMAVAFSKGNEELRDKYNVFLKEIQDNGTYNQIYERWFGKGNKYSKMPVIPNKGDKGVIRMGTTAVYYPYSFVQDGRYAGMDIELPERFAASIGMKLDIQTFTFPSMITAISTGKIDMASNTISVTEERAKMIAFGNPHMWSKSGAAVMSAKGRENENFIASLKNNIYKTFVQDDRYKLLLKGIWCTVKISVLSILLGTILGFLICWMRMSSVKWLVKFTKAYIYFFRGIPQVVFLMLLFYVVFASSKLSGEIVSIIGFGITFSAYVCEMFRTSIESVNKGQIEAGLAMGFTPFQSFRFFTLPIMIQRVFPVYIGEVIGLIKATSIVGYIAVEDLTKASDMIRSLTFDAFFSLIVITIIYFILIVLAINGLKSIQKLTAPKRNKFCTV